MTRDRLFAAWWNAINQQDAEALAALASSDHRFFVEGEAPSIGNVERIWRSYFELCPAYRVFADERYEREDALYVLGHTRGSHVDAALERTPSSVLWRFEADGNQVTEWSLYEVTTENRHRFNLPPAR